MTQAKPGAAVPVVCQHQFDVPIADKKVALQLVRRDSERTPQDEGSDWTNWREQIIAESKPRHGQYGIGTGLYQRVLFALPQDAEPTYRERLQWLVRVRAEVDDPRIDAKRRKTEWRIGPIPPEQGE